MTSAASTERHRWHGLALHIQFADTPRPKRVREVDSALAKHLHAEGWSVEKIAEELNRPPHQVLNLLR